MTVCNLVELRHDYNGDDVVWNAFNVNINYMAMRRNKIVYSKDEKYISGLLEKDVNKWTVYAQRDKTLESKADELYDLFCCGYFKKEENALNVFVLMIKTYVGFKAEMYREKMDEDEDEESDVSIYEGPQEPFVNNYFTASESD